VANSLNLRLQGHKSATAEGLFLIASPINEFWVFVTMLLID
jgi:hypothetical protein